MHIIIPMSGIGKRFVDRGYTTPKPLIMVDNKPIIEHVVNMFPGENKFTFICNHNHLISTNMRCELERIAPWSRIISIEPHKKGPVHAVTYIADTLDDDEEVIVNYCDFSTYWDYEDFLRHTRNRDADGAVVSYRGFHPHMLGTTQYAFLKDKNQWMERIQEKKPFTDNRMEEFASNGTYYFKKGRYVKKYFRAMMDKGLKVSGEYYVSLIYNLMRSEGLMISIYEVQHMLQWGTPQDLEEYQRWSDYFRRTMISSTLVDVEKGSINLIPLSGQGSRFSSMGINTPKPLIPVATRPMILQSSYYMPPAQKNIFVCLKSHIDKYGIDKTIHKHYPDARIAVLDHVTRGQAETCQFGLSGERLNSPLFIGACDNGMVWDHEAYMKLRDCPATDVIIWSFRHNQASAVHPEYYGWIDADVFGNVRRISVKKAISDDPYNDHAIVGAFYFKKARYFTWALNQLYKKNIKVNGEFYVDSCIKEILGTRLNVKVFEVDNYICWGTPNDLRTYNYWQSFFHKCPWHPYLIEKDTIVDRSKIKNLEKSFVNFSQEWA